MEHFRAGEELALREAFIHDGGKVQRAGMLCLGNDQVADDLLRRVFVRPRRGRDGFTPTAAVPARGCSASPTGWSPDQYPDPGP